MTSCLLLTQATSPHILNRPSLSKYSTPFFPSLTNLGRWLFKSQCRFQEDARRGRRFRKGAADFLTVISLLQSLRPKPMALLCFQLPSPNCPEDRAAPSHGLLHRWGWYKANEPWKAHGLSPHLKGWESVQTEQ